MIVFEVFPELGRDENTGWIFDIMMSGIAMTLPFSVLSDSVDFGEWKTGIRAAGLLTAVGAAFCLKAGAGIGRALPARVMGAYGYVPKEAQTPRLSPALRLALSGYPRSSSPWRSSRCSFIKNMKPWNRRYMRI